MRTLAGDSDGDLGDAIRAREHRRQYCVPLNTRLAGPEVAFHLEDAGAQMLIASTTMEPLAVAGVEDTDVERVIFVDDGARVPAEEGRLAMPFENYSDVLADASAERPSVNVGLDDLADISLHLGDYR